MKTKLEGPRGNRFWTERKKLPWNTGLDFINKDCGSLLECGDAAFTW